MKSGDLLFWIWLAEALGAANSDLRYLIDLYESPYDLFCADAAELERLEGLSPKAAAALSNKNLEPASKILDDCERLGIGVMPYTSELYPAILREIKTPPVLLYYAGTVPQLDRKLSIGMVGTRKMSVYGMETAYKIAYELAAADAIIVSGLAEGIDGVCAAAALKSGGTTVAVLGCGLDVVYPAHHGLLMRQVAEHGLLLSEYPPGTKPMYFHFPTRNRLISGLSRGVVVVEAGLKSGSLITAKDAVMQGRDVFAVPANADGIGAEGANGLLRDGASFAADSSDIAVKYEYLFADALNTDRLAKARRHSTPDIAYLTDIGVIRVKENQTKSEDAPKGTSKERRAGSEAPSVLEGIGTEAVKASSQKQPKANREKQETGQVHAAETEHVQTPDAVLQSLSPVQRAILQAIPDDASLTVDELGNLEYPYSELVTALTMLEIMGLVRKLPGSLYSKV